jgi:hypothetical protein
MAIFITLENSDGDILAPAIDIVHLQKIFRGTAEGHYLRFIADDIDFSCNQYQLPFARAEFEALQPRVQTPEEQKELDKILGYCRKGEELQRAYLKFYGDRY